jgi:hypothetical protein
MRRSTKNLKVAAEKVKAREGASVKGNEKAKKNFRQ